VESLQEGINAGDQIKEQDIHSHYITVKYLDNFGTNDEPHENDTLLF